MKVLVLGSGGREHALCEKISRSPQLETLFCAPGSDAISLIAHCVDLNILNPDELARFSKKNKISLVVVGPEAPLAAGVADELKRRKIACFGPTQRAARLESSKAFAKAFMVKYKIPTADFKVFESFDKVARYLAQTPERPVVVKASGLAGGKGVFICRNKKEALLSAKKLMEDKIFKEAGSCVVIEEFLQGPELSAMALIDGESFVFLPLSRDHKRLQDGDLGPNTGGMGAFAPVSVSAKIKREVNAIFKKVLRGIRQEKMDYRGILYCGLILTESGPKVLEFNCRLGDPETQAVLPLIESDILSFFMATTRKRLKVMRLKVRKDFSVCVNLVSQGYPEKIKIGRPIRGLERKRQEVQIFHSGTASQNGKWRTSGGRVLSVVGTAPKLSDARRKAYRTASRIFFPGMGLRRDIASTNTKGDSHGSL